MSHAPANTKRDSYAWKYYIVYTTKVLNIVMVLLVTVYSISHVTDMTDVANVANVTYVTNVADLMTLYRHNVYYNTGYVFYNVSLPDGLLKESTDLILTVQ